MVTALAINPTVITPLDSGVTGSPQTVTTTGAPAWPTYSNAPTTHYSPMAAQSITAMPAAVQPVITAPILPDISQMEGQLKTGGALLSDISVNPNAVAKPLDRLQPTAIQTPQLSQGLNASTANLPVSPITLASTAPGATVTAPIVSANNQVGLGFNKKLFAISLGLLTVISLGALAMMMMQQYHISAATVGNWAQLSWPQ